MIAPQFWGRVDEWSSRLIGKSRDDGSIPFPASKLYFSSVSAFTLAHRACTAFLALSLRSSGVMAAALAGPPFFPPFLPRATA